MSFEFNKEVKAKKLWDIFYQFTQTPRPSKKEEKISKYICDFADQHNFKWQKDEVGNILMKVPGKGSRKDSEAVLIQNHIDMVTDAAPGIKIDFDNDPIPAYVDGKWLRSRGTTLGADNGIGCAAAMAIAITDTDHPPLELLFTIDEETGLTGAQGLDGSMISAKKVINLDTEEWGSLYIGCAGGANFEINATLETIANPFDAAIELSVSSFNGGHSGVDIHRYRKNAVKGIVEILHELDIEFQISSISAGKAHNIIPRDASFTLVLSSGDVAKVEDVVRKKAQSWSNYLCEEDLDFELAVQKVQSPKEALTKFDSKKVLNFLTLFPNGAFSYVRETISEDSAPLVAISNNLAVTHVKEGQFYLLTSLRFFNRDESFELESKIRAICSTFDFKIQMNSQYPSWEPNFSTDLLKTSKEVYASKYDKAPEVKAIHAGLECGLLLDRMSPGAEAISFGPTIVDAHSPDERVDIDSVDFFWDYLKDILIKI